MITSSPAAFSQNAFPFSTDDSFWAPPPHQPSVSNDALSLNFSPQQCWNIRGVLRLKSGHLMLEMIRREMPLTFAPSELSPPILLLPSLQINFIHIALVFVLVCYRPISRPLFRIFRFLCISLNFTFFSRTIWWIVQWTTFYLNIFYSLHFFIQDPKMPSQYCHFTFSSQFLPNSWKKKVVSLFLIFVLIHSGSPAPCFLLHLLPFSSLSPRSAHCHACLPRWFD